MPTRPPLDSTVLRAFNVSYNISHQDLAFQVRGDFLRKFPKNRLTELEVDDYVIGHKKPTFCDYVEVKTRSWANILGATAFKFGIYFGKTTSDPRLIYRFTLKYGRTPNSAFKAVKAALLDLVHQGGKKNLDFAAIDANPLSQMFKAKILSLYYPNRFLNVCSAEHLEMLGSKLGCPDNLMTSEYQHLLLQRKLNHPITRDWSNPKFMAFLYKTYMRAAARVQVNRIQKPRTKVHRKMNFEDIQGKRDAIGKAAEDYALSWEKERLRGEDLEHLIGKIEDRRDRPGYGYDFMSHCSALGQRFIEVKSVAKVPKDGSYRFHLSNTQFVASRSKEFRDAYFFYLVFFDGNGQPMDLHPKLAKDLYPVAEMTTESYVVRFDLQRSMKKK